VIRQDLAQLRALPQPTLVLHGANDKVVPVIWGPQLAQLIPNGQIEVFAGAEHNFLPTHAAEVVRSLSGFLRDDALSG